MMLLRATQGIHLKHQGILYNFVGCLDEDFCCYKNIFDHMYESLKGAPSPSHQLICIITLFSGKC
jgi:hypothetical protein